MTLDGYIPDFTRTWQLSIEMYSVINLVMALDTCLLPVLRIFQMKRWWLFFSLTDLWSRISSSRVTHINFYILSIHIQWMTTSDTESNRTSEKDWSFLKVPFNMKTRPGRPKLTSRLPQPVVVKKIHYTLWLIIHFLYFKGNMTSWCPSCYDQSQFDCSNT